MKKCDFVVFVHLKAHVSWLSLSRNERNRIAQTELMPIFKKYPSIKHQHFDAEAFNGRVSDIELFVAPDPQQFYFLFEEFRDSALIAKEYFSVVDIFPSFADGYQAFESEST